MRWCYGLLLGMAFAASGYAQTIVLEPGKDYYVRMAGHIVDNRDGKPIPFVTVRNLQTRKSVASDSNGFFTIVLCQRDTLEFRRLGYKTLRYTKSPSRNGNYYEDIALQDAALELREVTIYRRRGPLRTIAINPDFERPDKFHLQIGPAKGVQYPATVANPLTYLYERYSKRGRALEKLTELRREKELQDLAYIRYNEYYVESLTGLKGADLAQFMRYCPMQANFIISASDYELAATVLNCYRRFMNDL